MSDGDAHHVLIIPTMLSPGETPEFAMVRDPDRGMEEQLIQLAVMQATVAEFGGNVFVDSMDQTLRDQGMNPDAHSAIRGWMSNIQDEIGGFVEDNTEDKPEVREDESSETQEDDSGSGDIGTGMMDMFTSAVPMEMTDVKPPTRPKQVTYQQAQSVAGMTVMMLLFALTSCGSALLAEREAGTSSSIVRAAN